MPVAAHVFITGRVQGVYFRDGTQERAQRHGVTGWVRNLADGRVEAVFEGDESAVAAMIAFCRRGPAYARVDQVVIAYRRYSGAFQEFTILPTPRPA
ncbi:MAG: acylphosphatase [Methanomicrobiales archaeon]|nr:acylphosphatase [Methanomicrobiales archaeon]